jgi:hypothetical protein
MDAQVWIYIIIGVIYFLSRLLKKPEQAPGEVPEPQNRERRIPRPPGQPATDQPRPLTFEELLREITEGKQVQQRQPEREVVTEYKSYEKDLGEEARSLEDVDFNEADRAEKWKPYEEVPARSQERKSLEETMRLEDTVVDFRRFQAFEKKNQRKLLDDYSRLLRNPVTLKQAVVLSEILKTKF